MAKAATYLSQAPGAAPASKKTVIKKLVAAPAPAPAASSIAHVTMIYRITNGPRTGHVLLGKETNFAIERYLNSKTKTGNPIYFQQQINIPTVPSATLQNREALSGQLITSAIGKNIVSNNTIFATLGKQSRQASKAAGQTVYSTVLRKSRRDNQYGAIKGSTDGEPEDIAADREVGEELGDLVRIGLAELLPSNNQLAPGAGGAAANPRAIKQINGTEAMYLIDVSEAEATLIEAEIQRRLLLGIGEMEDLCFKDLSTIPNLNQKTQDALREFKIVWAANPAAVPQPCAAPAGQNPLVAHIASKRAAAAAKEKAKANAAAAAAAAAKTKANASAAAFAQAEKNMPANITQTEKFTVMATGEEMTREWHGDTYFKEIRKDGSSTIFKLAREIDEKPTKKYEFQRVNNPMFARRFTKLLGKYKQAGGKRKTRRSRKTRRNRKTRGRSRK